MSLNKQTIGALCYRYYTDSVISAYYDGINIIQIVVKNKAVLLCKIWVNSANEFQRPSLSSLTSTFYDLIKVTFLLEMLCKICSICCNGIGCSIVLRGSVYSLLLKFENEMNGKRRVKC